MIRRLAIASVFICGFQASPVLAQTVDVNLTAGAQQWDTDGNESMFRSQRNETDGFSIESLSLNIADLEQKSPLFDLIRLDASGFGGHSHGRAHLSAKAAGYRLDLKYYRDRIFSELAGFANPFPEQGIFPGQHTQDQRRNRWSMDLTLFPGSRISPVLAYTRTTLSGPARTTYHVGQDEFQLGSDVSQTHNEVKAGIAFRLGSFNGELSRFRSRFKRDETLTLAEDGGGNNEPPVLGNEVFIDSFSRVARTDIDAPRTSLTFSGRIQPKLALSGAFVDTDPQTSYSEDEDLSGHLISFQLARIFDNWNETIDAESDRDSRRGHLRLDWDLPADMQLKLRYGRQEREQDGAALIRTLLLDSVTLGNSSVSDLVRALSTASSIDRDETAWSVEAVKPLPAGFRAWAGWTRTGQDLSVTQDIAQVVIPLGQGGSFEREVDLYQAGAAYRKGGNAARLAYQRESADHPIFRTDFDDREKLRFQGSMTLGRIGQLQGRYQWRAWENDVTDAALDADEQRYALEFALRERKGWQLSAGWEKLEIDSDVLIRRPQDFQTVLSHHEERGETATLQFGGSLGSLWVNGDLVRFENEGVFPFQLDQAILRAEWRFTEKLGAILDWEYRDYTETELAAADYRARGYRLLIRWQD